MQNILFSLSALATLIAFSMSGRPSQAAETESAKKEVSFFRDIRPIFQAHCQGCHQPAKAGGDYVLSTHASALAAGESGEPAIVPGNPDGSSLIALITPTDGQAEMPKGKSPLSEPEIDLIRRWIAAGAQDDTPESALRQYSQDNLPTYTRPPVVTSLDFSPDGTLLAISGFHEVILRSADGAQLVGRLVGESQRIESVAFSPDGSRLAVAGGQPGQLGELQIWNVASRTLELSIPVTHDTVYGASWSPDGKMVAVGCASDSSVHAYDAETGKQVFFNGAHDDWALDTVFSVDGSMLVSVGRDMATKLYNVPTQRFIDNVTSITPGALKGGISAVARHPERDEILVGGSDGVPRLYRMERATKRVIGDDANLIRRLPEMTGRIFSVSYSPDGKTAACSSSLNGVGQVFTYAVDVPFEMPDEIKRIVEKIAQTQKEEERKTLEAYLTADVSVLTRTEIPTPVYSLVYHPSGESIVAAGSDGLVRVINPIDGTIVNEFVPVELVHGNDQQAHRPTTTAAIFSQPLSGQESLPENAQLTGLEIIPDAIRLTGAHDSAQLLVTGILASGDRIDLTRIIKPEVEGDSVAVSVLGRVTPVQDGISRIVFRHGALEAGVSSQVEGHADSRPMDFIRDVNPVLTRLGCNQGTCHGAQDGKNGFKLSLRGYDPIFDVRAFTDDLKSRRTNVASPDDSLMLLKASGAVPHMGGQLTRPGESYYEVLRQWIAEGTQLNMNSARVASIQIQPHNPIVQTIGARQQLRVVAEYTDGSVRDVSGDAFLESGNSEVAEVNRVGVATAIRRGEAPVLARFEGAYAATTLTVMGDRSDFVWTEPETWNPIDEMVAAKWKRMKIQPSELCSDEEFIRRCYLDLTGLPPSAEDVLTFLADERPVREKRDALVDQLIGSDPYIDFWTNKWADMLQVNGKFLGKEGALLFREWIRSQVAENVPYDQFAKKVLTATGSNKENPAASYYKILRTPDAMMENTTHLFLGVRFNCNKCHDHPFERWTQDQYYETAAFFAQVGLKRDPLNEQGDIGGSAVEDKQPLWEVVFDKEDGEMKHERTGAVMAPQAPYDRDLNVSVDENNRRERLAAWIVAPQNDYFARSYVNRVWGYLLGVGLIEPLDDIRAGNPPSNPELLDWLANQFIESGHDVRELMRTICKSRTYQLAIESNEWNADDTLNYSHALPKRLPAEVLYDAVYTVTGAKMKIPGVPEGTRAAALPDVTIGLEDGFLDNLGRPVRESACECERSSELQLGPVMALMNGPTVSQAISQSDNALAQIVETESDNNELINKIFLRILNRAARQDEIDATLDMMGRLDPQHAELVREFKEYEEKIAPETEERAKQHAAALAEAQKEYDEYEKESAPRIAEEKKAWQEKLDAAKVAVEERLATDAQRREEWEVGITQQKTEWTSIDFDELSAAGGATLTKQPDLSLLASGPLDNNNYFCATTLKNQTVTAIRLEALRDESLPRNGPGRAADGNFVLSELELQTWSPANPEAKTELRLKNAQASFDVENFKVASAIDGNAPMFSNGWAVSGKTGRDQIATFELEEPLVITDGTVLQFKLIHEFFGAKHCLGRFRFSVTSQEPPVELGLPEHIRGILAVAAGERTEEQKGALQTYFNDQDDELATLQKAVLDAEKPLAEDAKLVALRKVLNERKKPLTEDPHLARLRRSVELSEAQLKNEKLTMAQDLAWALINSPAFLFNR